MKTPRRRPGESSQKHGTRFERFFASLFGVEPVKGSGNQWHAKMDVGDGAVLWNLKHSDSDYLRFGPYKIKNLIVQAEQAINGPGGVGGSTIPGVAINENGEAYVTLRAEDFLRLVKSGNYQYVVPAKGEQKRARGKVPALLRDDD